MQAGYRVRHAPELSEYICSTPRLMLKEGHISATYRKKCERFALDFPYTVRKIQEEDIPEMLQVIEELGGIYGNDAIDLDAAKISLQNFKALGLTGILLRTEDDRIAFSFGFMSAPDIYTMFTVKYDSGLPAQVTAVCTKEEASLIVDTLHNLTSVTAEKERISTELNVATQIQADMLPRVFPPFPSRNEFDIYATMAPAKEVGGDFYDFFLTDEDHLCMVMADVSGKGVPAALFMVIAKTLIKNRAQMGDSLFVYTDGVTEATDARNELFGTDRILKALNRDPSASPREQLTEVKKAIDTFCGQAPQFDDITMLGFFFSGTAEDEKTGS